MHAPVARAEAGVVGLDARFECGVERGVVRRGRIGRGALEHRQLRACRAMSGMACTADEPVPTTATRWPLKSTGSCGQSAVWNTGPAKFSQAGKVG